MIRYNGHPVVGFGQEALTPPAATTTSSEWPMMLASSVVGAAATWAIEETARAFRGRRR